MCCAKWTVGDRGGDVGGVDNSFGKRINRQTDRAETLQARAREREGERRRERLQAK